MSVVRTLLLLALAGCVTEKGSDHDRGVDASTLPSGCELPVSTSDFSLQMIGLANGRGGFPIDIATDGAFVGVMPISNARCEGTLTSTERGDLTAALNAARLFCRSDQTDCGTERDNTYEDIRVRNSDPSRRNHFCYVDCFAARDEVMSTFLSAAFAPLSRVYDAGGCTASTYTPPGATERCGAR